MKRMIIEVRGGAMAVCIAKAGGTIPAGTATAVIDTAGNSFLGQNSVGLTTAVTRCA